MTSGDLWWSYWYFHLPNYVLAALLYTMFGRFLMSLFLAPASPNYIYRWFRRLTDWFLVPVRFVTPLVVHEKYLPLCGAFWLFVLRFAFFLTMASAGLVPRIGPATGG